MLLYIHYKSFIYFKVQDYETSRQQMFLGTPPIHKKLHSPESFPLTYAVKRDPAFADGVGNISEGMQIVLEIYAISIKLH